MIRTWTLGHTGVNQAIFSGRRHRRRCCCSSTCTSTSGSCRWRSPTQSSALTSILPFYSSDFRWGVSGAYFYFIRFCRNLRIKLNLVQFKVCNYDLWCLQNNLKSKIIVHLNQTTLYLMYMNISVSKNLRKRVPKWRFKKSIQGVEPLKLQSLQLDIFKENHYWTQVCVPQWSVQNIVILS
jgi:hypothetical protein